MITFRLGDGPIIHMSHKRAFDLCIHRDPQTPHEKIALDLMDALMVEELDNP